MVNYTVGILGVGMGKRATEEYKSKKLEELVLANRVKTSTFSSLLGYTRPIHLISDLMGDYYQMK
jgi:hypothetical protein